MHVWAGTSGYAYKEWKGSFYPDDSRPDSWLRFYAQHLETVEINNTFYRMPSTKMLESWASEVPESFQFVIKMSRRVTHFKRLRGVDDEIDYLQSTLEQLGSRLGPVFIQLPPNMPKDLPRLQEFLMRVPRDWRTVMQFGDQRWLEQDVFDALRAENVALCLTDEPKKETPLVSTAPWGYVRLRKDGYNEADLLAWRQHFETLGWDDVFVLFKHEKRAPELALELKRLVAG